VARFPQETRERAHSGAGDAEQVDAHAAIERISFAAPRPAIPAE
jgi:hypothetical protein